MAYSDYGGRVYLNGVRDDSLCDGVIRPDGSLLTTPGAYPGFSVELVEAYEDSPEQMPLGYHALLGEPPLQVGLRKQSMVGLYTAGTELPFEQMFREMHPEFFDRNTYTKDGEEHEYFWMNLDKVCAQKRPFRFRFGDYILEWKCWESDNYYQTARVTFPDGRVWMAWAGYGVGCGLEDSPYHPFDSEQVDAEAKAIWEGVDAA